MAGNAKIWSMGKLVGVCCGIVALALALTLGLSALTLPRSMHVDEENGTVFVSYEGQPQCGVVLELVNPDDLEAGDVVSGDAGACEVRNLLVGVLQVLVRIGAIGTLLWVVWTQLGARASVEKPPRSA